ncbi:hypothetical protein HF888_09505 [Bermanella marisrubri]|uniref:Glutaredoxin domain-containing protein n=1 Tax=Bermanella marisrubri TaxID=207949 RepID=Q1N6D0_9GAMM|nr:glutaredoxin domain-containing protein [Bermanella marisrubri]EAT13662.1 hypothetical protein RED65_09729 [Oceanobacter sp. RED65] [Bermanella marisrubri]QIZ84445.1 hypothetical protein HF888_09505 [Bermanella marisrubri]
MKYIALIIVLLAAYQYIDRTTSIAIPSGVDIVDTNNFVAVYGRDSCSITQQVKSYLQQNGIDYVYLNVDDRQVADELHKQMKEQGLSTRRYSLPVVNFSGELSVQPNKQMILDEANG